jgi:hypothetical protein
MRTNWKKLVTSTLGAADADAAAPALLFLGAGTAQAQMGVVPTQPQPWGTKNYSQRDNPLDSWRDYNVDWYHRLPAGQIVHLDTLGPRQSGVSCYGNECRQGQNPLLSKPRTLARDGTSSPNRTRPSGAATSSTGSARDRRPETQMLAGCDETRPATRFSKRVRVAQTGETCRELKSIKATRNLSAVRGDET